MPEHETSLPAGRPAPPGRPPRPGGPTETARHLGSIAPRGPRDGVVVFTLALREIAEDGNQDLADEIAATLKVDGGKDRSWTSGVQFVARFRAEDQRWAWEQLQRRGVRWLKRALETQRNPPDADTLADRLAAWLNREYPNVDRETLADALGLLLADVRAESEESS